MTDRERIQLAHHILTSPAAAEMDAVRIDHNQGRPVTKREQALAGVVDRLYRIVHPAMSTQCKHEDWEKENQAEIEAIRDRATGRE